jgi:Glycosyl transferase family 2
MPEGNSLEHIRTFLTKIHTKESHCVIRPSDGEYMVLQGLNFNNIDNWHFNGVGSLKKDLHSAISTAAKTPDTYIGIPCPCCNNDILSWYCNEFGLTKNNTTYANLYCNRNWPFFIQYMTTEQVPFYFIGPKVSNKEHELNILDHFITDEFLVNNWDSQKLDVSARLREWMKGKQGVFCFSVGPIAKIWASELFREFPGNIMIDIGSSFDKFIKGSSNRDYANGIKFSNLVCDFKDSLKEDTKTPTEDNQPPTADITVVLTVYRRPHTLIQQLDAVQNQSVPPQSIIIWKNQYDGITLPEIPEHLMKNVSIIDSGKNFGVWARFAVSLLANTPYVCVFDDDTIPGRRWFENCLNSMKIREGLMGTIGLVFHTNNYWEYNRVGWDSKNNCNNKDLTEVDIVGHSWFFKREWLCDLWSIAPDYSKFLTYGEDIAFAAFLQKKGIPTLVPPHPHGQWDLFGSHPQLAWKYGSEEVGIWAKPESSSRFPELLDFFIKNHGFKLLHSRL